MLAAFLPRFIAIILEINLLQEVLLLQYTGQITKTGSFAKSALSANL